MSELDLNKVGTYKASITIKETPVKGEDKKPVFIKIDGQSKSLKCWPDQLEKFATLPEAGVTGEATIDVTSRTHSTTGDTVIEAWLKTFGGDNKGKQKGGGGYGGGKAYTPKTDAEIHSPSIAGIVKSAMEFCDEQTPFEDLCELGLKWYFKGLSMVPPGKASAVPASPQEAPAIDTDALKAEANEYWKSIGGTPEQMEELKKACTENSHKSYEIILQGKKTNAKPDVIIRLAGGVPNRGKAEPGPHRDPISPNVSEKPLESEEEPETDWYVEWRKISDAQGWPGFGEANAAWQVVLKKLFPGRSIKKADHLHTPDYYYLVQWGIRALAGDEDIPAGFKAHAREVANV